MNKKRGIKGAINKGRYLIYAGLFGIKRDGLGMTARRTLNFFGIGRSLSFRQWAKTPLYTDEQLEWQRKETFDAPVKFSIITPLYNTNEVFLKDMIESVIAQTYPDWELCLADGSDAQHEYVEKICREYAEKDRRIKYKKLGKNSGIAGNTNACIEMAEGDYISLLDHDDILHPAALHDVMKKICDEGADFIFTDEAVFEGPDPRKVKVIHFKPDYAPDNLRVNNYICHFSSFRRSLIEKCGGFREGFEGSQDHELFLRLTDAAGRVAHIPEMLYYWRAHEGSTARYSGNKYYAQESGKKAVESFLKSKGIRAKVSDAEGLSNIYRISYEIPADHPKVSIVIPSCDHVEDLSNCVSSILKMTTYDNYEIVIVENNSKAAETFEYYKTIESGHDNIRVATWPGTGFNWSAINNYAVREEVSGEYILLLNNDTEVITPDWIQEMLMYAQRSDVGVVGAKLYYPDGTVQHAGVILGLIGVAGHAFVGCRGDAIGYMERLGFVQNLSAVTGACMMTRRSVYEQVGGMDEELAVELNDIDFCMKARDAGYLNVWTPYAELYHYESKSRGLNKNYRQRARSEHERDLFACRWSDALEKGDPYFNPNLSLLHTGFEPKRRGKRGSDG